MDKIPGVDTNVWQIFEPEVKTKPNVSLYLPYYAETCNELALPIFASKRQGNTVICVDVEAVANRLQRCVRFGRSLEF